MSYIYVDKLRHIQFKCYKILPAVYDESLSYYETLCKCIANVNDLIDNTNILIDNVNLLNNSVIELNDRVSVVENNMQGFEDRINQRFIELQQEIESRVDDKLSEVDLKLVDVDNKLHEVDLKLDDVDARITALENRLNEEIENFRVYMEAELLRIQNEMRKVLDDALKELDSRFDKFSKDMQIYVKEEIRKALERIPDITSVMVKNPCTGKIVKIQTAIDDIFIHASTNALTIDEKNSLKLTIDEKNHIMVHSIPRGMTVYEWLRYAKEYIVKSFDSERIKEIAYPHSIVHDIYSGKHKWHDDVVKNEWQNTEFMNTLTVSEKFSQGLTIQEMNDLQMTISDFISKGNLIIAERT